MELKWQVQVYPSQWANSDEIITSIAALINWKRKIDAIRVVNRLLKAKQAYHISKLN